MVNGSLDVYMNEYYVGIFTKKSSGFSFQYTEDWVNQTVEVVPSLFDAITASKNIKETVLYNFFDNLLPDNTEIRNRIVSRYNANSNQPLTH